MNKKAKIAIIINSIVMGLAIYFNEYKGVVLLSNIISFTLGLYVYDTFDKPTKI